MIFTITTVCILMGLLYYHYVMKFSRLKKLTANMPSLKCWPIIGSFLEFGRTSDVVLQNCIRIANENGPVVAFWMGGKLFILLSGADEIQAVLSNNRLIKKGKLYNFFKPWLGPGLIVSHGDEWRKQRKLITPAFHFKILEQFVDVFSLNTNKLIDKLKNEVGKPGFEIVEHITLCVLDIICETSMGVEISAQLQEKGNKFVHAITDITFSAIHRSVRPWLFPNKLFNLTSVGKLFYQSLDIINNFIEQVIDSKKKLKAQEKSKNVNNEDSSVLGEKKKSAFLDLLLEHNLKDDEIKSQVNTVMFGGHDTTTSAVGFALHLLMKHPKVQDKVVEELNQIFGDSNRPATFHDLKNMKYLKRVIQETLRMYTSIPIIFRQITEDVQLSSYILPKGSTVCLFLHKLHYDPKLFPEPDVFNPDRFLPDVVKSRHPYAYCPFSAGSRNCIGQRFGMLEIKVIISGILRKFKILPPLADCPDIILGLDAVLRSLTGIHVRLENR